MRPLEHERGEELSEAELVFHAVLEHGSSGCDSVWCRFMGRGEVFTLLVHKGTVDGLCWLITHLEVSGDSYSGCCRMFSVFPSMKVGPSYL